MKILYIGYPLVQSGAPHNHMAAFQLSREGHDVLFTAWGEPSLDHEVRSYAPRLKYVLQKKKGVLSAISFLRHIMKEMKAFCPDILYVEGAPHAPFALYLARTLDPSRLVYHTQNFLEPGRHPLHEYFERNIAQKAGTVIFNEPNRANFAKDHYRLKEAPLVINTYLPSWWKVPAKHKDPEGGKRTIVTGGGFGIDRMSPQILEAFSMLSRNYSLVFTGMDNPASSARHACEKLMKTLDIDFERVTFLKRLEYHELLDLFASAEIGMLLYPDTDIGHYYQAPGRLTEYARCGLPSVLSNFPGLKALAHKHRLGSLADPYSPESIRDAIEEIGSLSDKELCRLKKHVREVADNHLLYEIAARKVFGIIKEKVSSI